MLEFFIKPVTADGGVSYMPTGAGYAVLIGIAYGPENTEERDAVLDAVKAL